MGARLILLIKFRLDYSFEKLTKAIINKLKITKLVLVLKRVMLSIGY